MITISIAAVGCSAQPRPASPKTPVAASPSALATEFVEYVRLEDWDEVHRRMERAYRDASSVHDLEAVYDQLASLYGKPQRFEYKGEAAGQRIYSSGVVKTMNKYWFATPTPNHPSGVYCFVEVVEDENVPAVAAFMIVMFQGNPPDFLK